MNNEQNEQFIRKTKTCTLICRNAQNLKAKACTVSLHQLPLQRDCPKTREHIAGCRVNADSSAVKAGITYKTKHYGKSWILAARSKRQACRIGATEGRGWQHREKQRQTEESQDT